MDKAPLKDKLLDRFLNDFMAWEGSAQWDTVEALILRLPEQEQISFLLGQYVNDTRMIVVDDITYEVPVAVADMIDSYKATEMEK